MQPRTPVVQLAQPRRVARAAVLAPAQAVRLRARAVVTEAPPRARAAVPEETAREPEVAAPAETAMAVKPAEGSEAPVRARAARPGRRPAAVPA